MDTSVWVDHLREVDFELVRLLERSQVFVHPWVVGEIALGQLHDRDAVIDLLGNLPQVPLASHGEVMGFISEARLYGRGIGYVDAHLLAGARLAPGTRLWTRDRRLDVVAREHGLAHEAGGSPQPPPPRRPV